LIEKGKEKYICLLNKALYGLKQALRTYEKMTNTLLELNFKKSSREPCVFIKRSDSELIILIYADDYYYY